MPRKIPKRGSKDNALGWTAEETQPHRRQEGYKVASDKAILTLRTYLASCEEKHMSEIKSRVLVESFRNETKQFYHL